MSKKIKPDPVIKKIHKWMQRPRQLHVFNVPKSFPKLSNNILNWAIHAAKTDPYMVATAMETALKKKGQANVMFYTSRGRATKKMRFKLIEGVLNKKPIQIQMNAIDYRFPELRKYVLSSYAKKAIELHPFGISTKSALWVTGPGHTYNSHLDTNDHILFQLRGRKKIVFWGPSKNFDKKPIYNFDFRNDSKRFSGKKKVFELKAGEGVYFSRGTMHQVSVPGDEISVTFTTAINSLYPIMEIADQINESFSPKSLLRLKEKYAAWDKFGSYVFNPSRYNKKKFLNGHVPSDLKKAFLNALVINNSSQKIEYSLYFDKWWTRYSSEKKYCARGPLPREPKDRIKQLKQWEKERVLKLKEKIKSA